MARCSACSIYCAASLSTMLPVLCSKPSSKWAAHLPHPKMKEACAVRLWQHTGQLLLGEKTEKGFPEVTWILFTSITPPWFHSCPVLRWPTTGRKFSEALSHSKSCQCILRELGQLGFNRHNQTSMSFFLSEKKFVDGRLSNNLCKHLRNNGKD